MQVNNNNKQNGVFTNLSFDEYLSIEAVSNSGLTLFERSPLHYKTNYKKETASLKFGSAIHECITNYSSFERMYQRGPENPKGGKSHKGLKYWKDAAKESKKILLTPEEFDGALKIRETLFEHPFAGPLLSASSDAEVSFVWEDKQTGVKCKGRADLLCPEFSLILDIKSTVDARPFEFSKSLYNYNYYRQAAFYLDGLNMLQGEAYEDFVILAVEKEPPYGIQVYKISQTALEQGYYEIHALLPKIKKCIGENSFPGYDEEVSVLDLPIWATKKEEN